MFDAELLATGSYNGTRGTTRNHENLVLSSDPRLVAAFRREFERLWAAVA